MKRKSGVYTIIRKFTEELGRDMEMKKAVYEKSLRRYELASRRLKKMEERGV